MSIREKILSQFDVSTDSTDNLILTNKQTKQSITVTPCKDENVIIPIEILVNGEREESIPRIIKEIKGIPISAWSLYEMFSNLSEDERYEKFFGYDKRTHFLINGAKRSCGWIKSACDWEKEKLQSCTTYKISPEIEPVQCGRISTGEYVAQIVHWISEEDYVVEKHYFNRFPSPQNVQEMIAIRKIEEYFSLNPGTYKFQCWKCGKTVHWLDIKGGLKEKIEKAKEKYCGC